MSERRLTSPQRMLLNELDLDNLGKFFKKASKKVFINKKASGVDSSGNLETPPKNPRHREFMGQPENPHGTMADKPGRPDSSDVGENSIHATPTSMEDPTGLINLGEPLGRGLSFTSDSSDAHPSAKHKPVLQRQGEKPGTMSWNSFGNRYPGARS